MIFLRKHDFSRKLEGGPGLQGVSSNLNIYGFLSNSSGLFNNFLSNNVLSSKKKLGYSGRGWK